MITDARHAIPDNDCFNFFRIAIPRTFGRIVIIPHRPCAADGEGFSAAIVCIIDTIAACAVIRIFSEIGTHRYIALGHNEAVARGCNVVVLSVLHDKAAEYVSLVWCGGYRHIST